MGQTSISPLVSHWPVSPTTSPQLRWHRGHQVTTVPLLHAQSPDWRASSYGLKSTGSHSWKSLLPPGNEGGSSSHPAHPPFHVEGSAAQALQPCISAAGRDTGSWSGPEPHPRLSVGLHCLWEKSIYKPHLSFLYKIWWFKLKHCTGSGVFF